MEKTLARLYLETVLRQFGIRKRKRGGLIGEKEYRKAVKRKKGEKEKWNSRKG